MNLIHAAADLLLGSACPGCAVPGWGMCPSCRASLDVPPEFIDRGLDVPLVAACQYRPVLEHVIPRYKDDGALHLGAVLGDVLSLAVQALAPPQDAVLVPVPSRPAAVRQRGFDHGHRLAARAARRCGLRARRLLSRKAAGEDQLGLGRAQRSRNLEHSMRSDQASTPVIVIDDVATSGASLREAVRALRAAQVTVLGGAVVAQAEKLPQHSGKPGTPSWR